LFIIEKTTYGLKRDVPYPIITRNSRLIHPRPTSPYLKHTAAKEACASACKTQKGKLLAGKRVQFDADTWQQIDLLGRDQMKDFQELADEAFRDLLKKHGRPADLREALRRSVRVSATLHHLKPAKHT
jgi:hypothetical protein